ncbi:MAG TPA: phosphatase PAP2 family protein [Polyangiaceae bacterium]|jgi:membrane-associated phospholipid phosphatase
MSLSGLSARQAPQIVLARATLAAICLLFAARAGAEPSCRELAPWDRLGESGRNFARPLPLSLSAVAVAAPFGFAPTGLDQRLRVASQRDLGGRPNLEPVTIWTPYVIGTGLLVGYGVSALVQSCRAERALAPVLQAGVVTLASVSLLKFGVGRRFPNGGTDPNAPDRLDHPERARDFAPFQRGLGGWPSGHTAIMFSGAAAFRASNPELGVVSFAGYPFALAVAGGMWLGDHHYASDIISGALFGQAVGDSAGQSFAQAFGAPGAFTVLPTNDGGFVVEWAGVW